MQKGEMQNLPYEIHESKTVIKKIWTEENPDKL